MACFFRKNLISFIKNNTVMCIALLAAIITSFIVPIDREYSGYFDYKTLTCLFCVLAVVCALKNIGFFYILAKKVIQIFRTTRSSILALVYITFIGSMFIANDMALLTFLPLGYFVLSTANKKRYMAFTFIMQNIAANLGGMLTPFGNPQNLYLYTKYQIPDLEFIKIMAPPFLLSVAAITVCCIAFIKPEPLVLCDERVVLDPKKDNIVSRTVCAGDSNRVSHDPLLDRTDNHSRRSFLFADRKALKTVDYGLLFTFVFFFVFAGNMARIEAVRDLFSMLLKKNTLLFSVVSCQVISNVPSAILLSQFTGNYPELLVGVNIGGVGTLISSLASLITFRGICQA